MRAPELLLSLVVGLAGQPEIPADATARDYRFEALQQLTHQVPYGVVELHLVHVPTGRVIRDARILNVNLSMPTQGEGQMLGRAELQRNQGVDALRFVVIAPMEGAWMLDITAMVPDEPEPIHGAVPVYVETSRR